jgi:predicted phosphohydrolase
MKIFAVADTHLSGKPPSKPMDVFGGHWLNHWDKIKTDWQKKVSPDDIVLIAGDISWAMKFSDALFDLNEISSLPGKKILVKGNHDYWWQGVEKMTAATGGGLTFLHNTFFQTGDLAICGSRGWICPEETFFGETDLSIYRRELLRVEASLKAAQKTSSLKTILMLHFPPFSSKGLKSGFVDLIKHYDVTTCIYGHLHDDAASSAQTGLIDGVNYHLVSCDILDFKLKEIIP